MHTLSWLGTLWNVLIFLLTVDFANGDTNVTVDNLDGRIVFFAPSSTKWSILTGRTNAVDGTVSVTYTAGLFFYLQFQGTAIYIVGDSFEGAASFTPSIDGIVMANNIAGENAGHRLEPSWGVTGLVPGMNHTLNVTIGINPNVTVKSNFELDALMYTIDEGVSNTTAPVVASSSITATESSTFTQPTSFTGPSTPHKTSETATIVGGIVGGVVFLALCIITWLCLRKRSSRHHKHFNEEIVSRPFGQRPTEVYVLRHPEKRDDTRQHVIDPVVPADSSLSERIMQEMAELRVEVARLRDNGSAATRTESTAPPDYDTLSTVYR